MQTKIILDYSQIVAKELTHSYLETKCARTFKRPPAEEDFRCILNPPPKPPRACTSKHTQLHTRTHTHTHTHTHSQRWSLAISRPRPDRPPRWGRTFCVRLDWKEESRTDDVLWVGSGIDEMSLCRDDNFSAPTAAAAPAAVSAALVETLLDLKSAWKAMQCNRNNTVIHKWDMRQVWICAKPEAYDIRIRKHNIIGRQFDIPLSPDGPLERFVLVKSGLTLVIAAWKSVPCCRSYFGLFWQHLTWKLKPEARKPSVHLFEHVKSSAKHLLRALNSFKTSK